MTKKTTKTFAEEIQRVTEAIALGASFGEVSRSAVELLERLVKGGRCSIMRVDWEEACLRSGYAPSLPRAYLEAVDGLPIGEGAGSCGTAAHRSERVVVLDAHVDPLWAGLREWAKRFDIVACWSEPIRDREGIPQAVVTLYVAEARGPSKHEARMVGTVAHLLSLELQREDRERELRASEQRFRSLADNNPSAVCSFELDGCLHCCNASAEALFGLSAERLLGRHYERCVAEESVPQLQAAFQAAAAGTATRLEALLRRGNGESFPGHLSFLPIQEEGAVAGVFLVARDISQHKQAEEALRESERSLSTLLGNLPGMAFRCRNNRAWSMEFVSEGSEALTGYSVAAQLSGEVEYGALIRPEDRERVWEAVQAAIKRREPFQFTYGITTAEGERRWVWEQGRGVFDADGELLALEGFIADISVQRESELAAERRAQVLRLLSRCSERLAFAETEADLLEGVCSELAQERFVEAVWAGSFAEGESGQQYLARQAYVGESFEALEGLEPSHDLNVAALSPLAREWTGGEAPGELSRWPSSLCLPLRYGDTPLGGLLIGLASPTSLDGDLLALFEELADTVAAGLATQRAGARQRRVNEAVLAMARGLQAMPGTDYLDSLCSNLVEALGADAGFVACLEDEKPGWAWVRCGYQDGNPAKGMGYEIALTPCAQLEEKEVLVLRRGASARYPESAMMKGQAFEGYVGAQLRDQGGRVFGQVFALFREPVRDESFARSVIRIFATGAAAELQRERSDSLLKEQAALLEQSRDAIWVQDERGRIAYWNQGAARLLGWSAAEATGRQVKALLFGREDGYESALATVRREGTWLGELSLVGRDGSRREVESRWTFAPRDGSGLGSLLAINTDVTERRELERQFLRAQRMEGIGRIAGGVAHDLNNALAPILMSVGLLRMGETEPKRVERLRAIESSAQRGAAMVKQLLSFARGVEGKREAVDVGKLAREVARIAEDTFLKSVAVSCWVPETLPQIMGDSTQLHQVLLNLCVNARDAMPTGGTLAIEVVACEVDSAFAATLGEARPGPYLRVTVSDSGSGMSQEVQERIFDPFFTTKDFGQGTGLGLSTSLAIVRSHHGFVRVDSAPRAGTRFEVYLPVESSRVESEQVEAAGGETLNDLRGSGQRVLVVDDEEAVRSIAAQTLEAYGYRSETAASGTEAVTLLGKRSRDFEIALVDMMMPVLDGGSTIRVLLGVNPDLAVVACSGLSGKREAALAGGAAVFLAKPFSAADLLRAVRTALDKRAAGGDSER